MIEPSRQFDLFVLGTTSVSRRTAEAAEQAGLQSKLLFRSCNAAASLPNANVKQGGETVWSVIPEPGAGFRVDVIGKDGPQSFLAKRIAVEAMPIEVVVPFPGWTLDGVLGLGQALRLMDGEQPLRPMVAGSGEPFWSGIASLMARGTIPAVILSSDAGKGADGAFERSGRAELSARNITVYDGWHLVEAVGKDHVDGVLIAPNGAPSSEPLGIEIDSILVHDGITWRDEIPRLLGAKIHFLESGDGEAATTDEAGRTSIPGLYSVPREESQAIALGAQIAQDTADKSDWPAIRRDRTGAATRPTWADRLLNLPSDLLVCRYEPQTIGDLKEAIDSGARDLNQLKQFTRMGMGVCQGRPCEEITARLMAQHLGVPRSEVGRWTMRPPLEMVELSTLAGTFQYSDIPIPRPAPL